MLENGMDPANHPRAMTAAGLGVRVIPPKLPAGATRSVPFGIAAID
jgi:hypothetical protein